MTEPIEIEWKYLSGMSFNQRSYHRMYHAKVEGIEVRKESNQNSTWYYLTDEKGEYKDRNEFIKRLKARINEKSNQPENNKS